jgi:serine/threonine protein kinase
MIVLKGRNNDYEVIKAKNSEGAKLVIQLTGKDQGKLLQCFDGNVENALDYILFKQQSYSIIAFNPLDTNFTVNHRKVQLNQSTYWLPTDTQSWEMVGKGSCGKVYSAISADHQLVALKVFKREKDWQQELDNTQKLKALNPPKGICLPIDFGTSNNEWIIVFPRGTGNCHKTSMLPLSLLLEGILNLATSLYWLHSQGLYHGDIKLDNVLFTSNGLSFIDFGLLGSQITPTESIKYIFYRSPEMTVNKINFKTEVLALGVSFYQMFYCNLLLSNGISLVSDIEKYIPIYQQEKHPPKDWSSPYVLNSSELDNLLAGIFSRSYLPSEKPTLISLFQLIKDMLTLNDSIRPNAQDVCERIIKLQGMSYEQ